MVNLDSPTAESTIDIITVGVSFTWLIASGQQHLQMMGFNHYRLTPEIPLGGEKSPLIDGVRLGTPVVVSGG